MRRTGIVLLALVAGCSYHYDELRRDAAGEDAAVDSGVDQPRFDRMPDRSALDARDATDASDGGDGAADGNADWTGECIPVAPDDVTCDGTDDDCNGLTDDGYVARSCGTGVCRRWSVCSAGIEACLPGQPQAADLPDDSFADSNCDGIDGNAATAVFVAQDGDDGSPGTREQPKRTITAALATAAASTDRKQVYVSEGNYAGQVTLANGVSIYGGYSRAASWKRSNSATATISNSTVTSGRLIGVAGTAITSLTVIDHLTITTGDAKVAGASNYGLYCSGCSGLVLTHSTIRAGAGAPGADGANGQPGPAGIGGVNGGGSASFASAGPGGAGGVSACGRKGGDGGPGGEMGAGGPGGIGNAGAAGGAGAAAAGAGGPGTTDSSPPLPGANGVAGVGGAIEGGFWVTAAGQSGFSGSDGNGGGGGGGGGATCESIFGVDVCGSGGGGGGGGGGCGGAGAGGGGGGGGAFGLFLVGSTGAEILDCAVAAGNGGRGGAGGGGGPGGAAGKGGLGATTSVVRTIAAGGNGGDGSPGAAGGAGGGGAGGPSFGVVLFGSIVDLTTNAIAAGMPGMGGASFGNPGQIGAYRPVF